MTVAASWAQSFNVGSCSFCNDKTETVLLVRKREGGVLVRFCVTCLKSAVVAANSEHPDRPKVAEARPEDREERLARMEAAMSCPGCGAWIYVKPEEPKRDVRGDWHHPRCEALRQKEWR